MKRLLFSAFARVWRLPQPISPLCSPWGMMSRRESRVSINFRQNDALLEFENFKKKFLLANKHITKLNSTLSVRIEELNAQISALYVENLRLRASEIALATQLKKEKERSQRVISDAETATHALLKHFGVIRKNFSIPPGKPSSPSKHTQQAKQPPRKPILDPDASPHVNRLARAPNFPDIFEADEVVSDADDIDMESSPSPVMRRKRSRSSSSATSRLPVPSRASPPPPPPPIVATIHVDVDEHLLVLGKKRISRRQSGLLTVNTTPMAGSSRSSSRSEASSPRPPSPAFGSPARREAGLAEEEEEMAAMNGDIDIAQEDVEEELERTLRKERKRKSKLREIESPPENVKSRHREKRRTKDDDEFGSRSSLHPIDMHNLADRERQRSPDTDAPSSAMTQTSTSTRPLLSTPATTPAPYYLPTPRSSSPTPFMDPEMPVPGGREKRTRKSINYAEPKLNTKMRKPEPNPTSKRVSTSLQQNPDNIPRSSLDAAPIDYTTEGEPSIKRRKSRPRLPPEEEDESEGAQADAEFASGMSKSSWVNTEGRRRSSQSGKRLVEGDGGRRHSMAV